MEQFLKTHKPDDIVNGLFRLATGKSPESELRLESGSTTITVGSMPEKSEYMRYVRNSQEKIAAYEKNPNAVIAAYATEHSETQAEARANVEASIQKTKATLQKMSPILARSDIVSIEFAALEYAGIRDLVEQKVPGGVLDAASYNNGIPVYRCGPQVFPKQMVLTKEAFETVIQPLIQAKDLPLQQTAGFEVRDTTPNDQKATIAYGAALGTARTASGGCAK